jgi:hypothetical protein
MSGLFGDRVTGYQTHLADLDHYQAAVDHIAESRKMVEHQPRKLTPAERKQLARDAAAVARHQSGWSFDDIQGNF